MQPTTWNKAWVGGIAAPILNWLIGILAAWTLSLGYAMPDTVQAALVALLTGIIIYLIPNADPTPTQADEIAALQKQIADLEARKP